jgi:hypothetical protein
MALQREYLGKGAREAIDTALSTPVKMEEG